MKVLKFGGTSIGSVAAIRNVIDILLSQAKRTPVVLVFSALGETTDHLLEMARMAEKGELLAARERLKESEHYHLQLSAEVIQDPARCDDLRSKLAPFFRKLSELLGGIAALQDFSPPVQDEFLAHGELLSTQIMTAILRAQGLPAVWVDAREVMVTDSRFTAAEPDLSAIAVRARQVLVPELQRGRIPVLAGYIGRNSRGRTTTLGRGGSDFTAGILGAVLEAEEVQIWTDVDGIMTADPWLVPEARPVQRMSFQEAAELAYFGARVLHPRSIAPAMQRKIPVRVLNTLRPRSEGTLILAEKNGNGGPVKSIAYKEGMSWITIVSSQMFKSHIFLKRLFDILYEHRLAVDLMTTTEVSVALAIHNLQEKEPLLTDLGQLGRVDAREGMAVVCVVGEQIRESPGIAGRIFSVLGDVPIPTIAEGGSEINISFVCEEVYLPKVVRRLHKEFFG